MTEASLRDCIAQMRLALNMAEDDLDLVSAPHATRWSLNSIIAQCNQLKRSAAFHREEIERGSQS